MTYAIDYSHYEQTETATDVYRDLFHKLPSIPRSFKSVYLLDVNARLNSFRGLADDWDGYGSIKPSELTISKSINWLSNIYDEIIEAELPWIQPSVSLSADGEVVFEWWKKERKLTFYISDENIEYILVWGADIHNEMKSGNLQTGQFIAFWNWLMS
jgi:hypothetical protein